MSVIDKAAQIIQRTKAFNAAAAFGVPIDAKDECAQHIAQALADAGLLTDPATVLEQAANALETASADAVIWDGTNHVFVTHWLRDRANTHRENA